MYTMGQIKHLVILLSSIVCLSACNREPQIVPIAAPQQDYKEAKIAVNQEIARREQADIQLIAKRYDWDLKQTESGLWYEVVNVTGKVKAEKGDIVQLKGAITSADGKVVYSTERDGIKEMKVLGTEDVVGLHELVQLMAEGEHAHAIIPSFLAYGISGNGMEISALSSLICDIEIIKIVKIN